MFYIEAYLPLRHPANPTLVVCNYRSVDDSGWLTTGSFGL